MIKSSKFYAFLLIIYFLSLVLDLTRFGVSDFMQLTIKIIVHGLIFILYIRQVILNNIQLRLSFFLKAYLIITKNISKNNVVRNRLFRIDRIR